MEEVVVRKYCEVSFRGKTYVREFYAKGYLVQGGTFRLTQCIGRYGFGKSRIETVNQSTTNRAA